MKRTVRCSALLLLLLLLAACGQRGAEYRNDAVAAPQTEPGALAVSAKRAPRRVITCHLLLAGRPSPEPTIYELAGTDLYSTAPGGDRLLISSEGKLVHLSRIEDDEGSQDTFASHIVQGHVLTRTVLWQRPGQAPETASVEQFDFSGQTIIDAETGEDTCYHDAPPDGRTQEQAEREALRDLARGDHPRR